MLKVYQHALIYLIVAASGHLQAAAASIRTVDFIPSSSYPSDSVRADRRLMSAIAETKTQTEQYLNRQTGRRLDYLFDESMSLNSLTSGDEIFIHGEGEPFVIGFNEPSTDYDLHPAKLAERLIALGLPTDQDITIVLFSCHSAAEYKSICFARDLSLVFSQLGFENIIVKGFNGLLNFKRKGKVTGCFADPLPGADECLGER